MPVSLIVETIITGQLGANCYLIYDPQQKNALIIDPGDDAPYIRRYIEDLNLKPAMTIATHGHDDHISALTAIQHTYHLPAFINHRDQVVYGQNLNPKLVKNISSTSQIELDGYQFDVLRTPGHTPGGISLYCESEHILFPGDTIFAGGAIGRYDFPYSNVIDLTRSINQILKLPENTIMYPGHGPQTTVGTEKKYHQT
jgi:glyoxylase-like metal-dependent hydrolase (beta-lactamase superfamily II)